MSGHSASIHPVNRKHPVNSVLLDERSLELRRKIVRAIAAARRGHIASAFSLVEILRVLYDDVLRYDPTAPRAANRDRCVLSKGHGCLALYAILADKGFFPEAELDRFCHFDGILGGHPEFMKVPGVEASTGSLGHGLSISVGIALALKRTGASERVFTVTSDGECNEGSTWEAALCASKHRLSNLTVLLDYNRFQSFGTTSDVLELEPMADKWLAFGWQVEEADGHDVAALRAALHSGKPADERPRVVICHTIKGKGVKFVENNLAWHHKNRVTDEELRQLLEQLNGTTCARTA
jgi:transketolase